MSNAGEKRPTQADLDGERLTLHRVVNEKSQKDGLSPILAASTNGHLHVVKILAKSGANINDLNPEGQTPLILAAKNGSQQLLQWLIHNGAKLDMQDNQGRTALMHALASGFLDLARCLLEAGASHRPVDREGKTALFVAAECGHVAIVEHLLMEPGANLQVRDRQGRTVLMMIARTGKVWPLYKYISEAKLAELINDRDEAGYTPLLHAASQGRFHMCSRLLDWGAEAGAMTAEGQTAIMLACQRAQLYNPADDDTDAGIAGLEADTARWDQTAFLAALTKRDVPLDAVDCSGRTALFYAAERGELALMQHLLALSSNDRLQPDDVDSAGNTVLHAAARMGRDSIVRYLVSLPSILSLINEANVSCDVPLRLAVVSRSLKTFRALLDAGACLEKANSCRDPPLLYLACENGAEDIVPFLLQNKSPRFDPDSSDSQGVTALMAATRNDHIGIVEKLLNASADSNRVSSKGHTALTLAVQTTNIVIAKLLLNHKADPNLVAKDCKSPCSIAAAMNSCSLLDILHDFGANPFQKDSHGRNALFYCVALNRIEPLNMLVRWATRKMLEETFPFPSPSGNKYTLLAVAAEKGHLEAAKALMYCCPSPDILTSLGESSLHIACRRQDFAMVSYLAMYTKNIDCFSSREHLTPLMVACQLGNDRIAKELCRKGADVNIKNLRGLTPLYMSIRGKEPEVHRFLLLSVLIESGAILEDSDEQLFSREVWSLLKTLRKVNSQRSDKRNASSAGSGVSEKASASKSASSNSNKSQEGQDASKIKITATMTTEERLKAKLKKRLMEPDQENPNGSDAEGKKRESLETRSSKARADFQRARDMAEKNIRGMANMMKKHIATNALPQPMSKTSESKMEMEMKQQDLARLKRKPFLLTKTQLQQNRIVREFSVKMDQLRSDLVKQFKEKLDFMCQRRPRSRPARKLNGRKQDCDGYDSDAGSAASNRQARVRKVRWHVLHHLRYQCKSAKPSRGRLHSVLLKRLHNLKDRSRSRFSTRMRPLPSFWERVRVRNVAQHYLAPRMRWLTAAESKTKEQLLSKYSLVHLEGVALAVSGSKISWSPLPPLVQAGDEKNASKHFDYYGKEVAQRRRAKVRECPAVLLKRLESAEGFGARCSMLVRCGQRPSEVKVVNDKEDAQWQIDLSCSILPGVFLPEANIRPRHFDIEAPPEHSIYNSIASAIPLPPSASGSPRIVVKLSVNTRHCLWDASEVRSLTDALLQNCEHHERERHRVDLKKGLNSRHTYHQLSAYGFDRGQSCKLDSLVALHPALSTKLVSAVLLPGVMKAFKLPFSFHADDVLLARKPTEPELKQLHSLLGSGRVRMAEAYQIKL